MNFFVPPPRPLRLLLIELFGRDFFFVFPCGLGILCLRVSFRRLFAGLIVLCENYYFFYMRENSRALRSEPRNGKN